MRIKEINVHYERKPKTCFFFLRLRKNIQNIINNIIGSWAPDMISV